MSELYHGIIRMKRTPGEAGQDCIFYYKDEKEEFEKKVRDNSKNIENSLWKNKAKDVKSLMEATI